MSIAEKILVFGMVFAVAGLTLWSAFIKPTETFKAGATAVETHDWPLSHVFDFSCVPRGMMEKYDNLPPSHNSKH